MKSKFILSTLLLMPVFAQTTIKPLTFTLNDPLGGDPARQSLTDGTVVSRLDFSQPVTGEQSGILDEQSTQVFASTDEQGLVRITTRWKLTTDNGSLTGYYSGLRDRSMTGTRDSEQRGSVTSASATLTPYYEADVTYRISADDSGSVRGVLTIVPHTPIGNSFLGDVGASALAGAFQTPIDTASDPDGKTFYFIAQDASGSPAVYSVPALGGDATKVASGSPLTAPRGIAVSPLGTAWYVADPKAGSDHSGQILKMTAGGQLTGVPSTAGYAPHGIEIDRQDGDDMIYFTGRDPNDGSSGVFKVAATGAGTPITVWKGAPLTDPDGVAISHTGAVYVSDRSGSVYAINGQSISRIASGFQPGNPAGIALNRAESLLLISSLDPSKGTAQVLMVDLETFASAAADKVIGANLGAGGLHRAYFSDLFAWADTKATPGCGGPCGVYHVPVQPPK